VLELDFQGLVKNLSFAYKEVGKARAIAGERKLQPIGLSGCFL
jgi:hypothetical protein